MKKQMKIQTVIQTVDNKQYVTSAALLTVFPGLSKVRLRKALQRAEALPQLLNKEFYYKVNEVEKALADIAMRRPYLESVRQDYIENSKVKPKSDIKQISAEYISEWYTSSLAAEPDSEFPVNSDCFLNQDDLDEESKWDEQYFIKHEEKSLARYLELSDEVNRCLWQIDNTISCDLGIDNSYEILMRLYRYNLITVKNSKSKLGIIDLLQLVKPNSKSAEESLVEFAARTKRLDVWACLELNKRLPIDRTKYWQDTYSQQLGQPGIDYWSWASNKESMTICDELTALLSLPYPSGNAQVILQALAKGGNPFGDYSAKGRLNMDLFMAHYVFFNLTTERRSELRNAFIQWHRESVEQLGEDMMRRIYQRIYNTSWDIIEEIIQPLLIGEWHEVLGVPVNATEETVKRAYKALAKQYHPDVNADGESVMKAVNNAYKHFKEIKTQPKNNAYTWVS